MSERPEGSPVSHASFVRYIDRTREFYAAQGYAKAYAWAHYAEVPFAPLPRPLAACTVGLVTTAGPDGTPAHEPGVLRADKPVWSGPTDPPPARLYTDHLSWDKEATHTDDVDSFLPIGPLRHAAASGRIGALAPRFHGVPTDYSQRRTREADAPEIEKGLREDAADVALLVPL